MLECLAGGVGPKAHKRCVGGEDGESEDSFLEV